jgi:hypothetical protein
LIRFGCESFQNATVAAGFSLRRKTSPVKWKENPGKWGNKCLNSFPPFAFQFSLSPYGFWVFLVILKLGDTFVAFFIAGLSA